MAAQTEWHGEALKRPEMGSTREQDAVLHITINLLTVIPTREVQIATKGPETTSRHYWMNSLPFIKQTS